MKYIWRLWYKLFPYPKNNTPGLGKSGYIKSLCRMKGIKFIDIKLCKRKNN